MAEDDVFPAPTFAQARLDERKQRMPQCIGHRGYKAKYPENTMAAFKGAVAAGTHAIETDVHITKDDVVVLSHDGSLKRCFDRDEKIIDKTWDEIKDLRTTAEPHETMPRLKDLLEYLAQPGLEELWVLLDIKLDVDAETLMRLLASTMSSTPTAATGKPWDQRVVLGIWAAKYLPLCQAHLPTFPVMHIGFSTWYARHFFAIPKVGFNMLLPILIAPGGKSFLRDARQKQHRQVIAWTVNEEDRMTWCIRRQLDGVITDDVEKYVKVCQAYDDTKREGWLPISLGGLLDVYRWWVWITFVFRFWNKQFMPVASKGMVKRGQNP
ncbi:hypothetical protein BAUCODRAFT_31534 [Baudoinia panamericana UAMH 10762]|uniref:GP-PDE domain-containing protein n=1 Tax=Baudoinia panamericana (strain UAMH 10762) TaxID=717646 RepID=M2MQU9_BAUPA|nr:uncharacterized protein BAUCODRAFT_31534 [Baudoinia panamericana UAMH 10762]EMC99201.1 hypothetical protein BAUCODRAFT_31534 [Baudoinia panamericana UAMH 10762]